MNVYTIQYIFHYIFPLRHLFQINCPMNAVTKRLCLHHPGDDCPWSYDTGNPSKLTAMVGIFICTFGGSLKCGVPSYQLSLSYCLILFILMREPIVEKGNLTIFRIWRGSRCHCTIAWSSARPTPSSTSQQLPRTSSQASWCLSWHLSGCRRWEALWGWETPMGTSSPTSGGDSLMRGGTRRASRLPHSFCRASSSSGAWGMLSQSWRSWLRRQRC